MTNTVASVQDNLRALTEAWVTDPDSDIVWAGTHDGRWGIRMAQQTRDFTTVWFDVGEHTLSCEAYLLPAPPSGKEEVYRQCLVRNWSSWPVWVAIDPQGELYIHGRLPLSTADSTGIDQLVGAVYELVDRSFRSLIAAGFSRPPPAG